MPDNDTIILSLVDRVNRTSSLAGENPSLSYGEYEDTKKLYASITISKDQLLDAGLSFKPAPKDNLETMLFAAQTMRNKFRSMGFKVADPFNAKPGEIPEMDVKGDGKGGIVIIGDFEAMERLQVACRKELLEKSKAQFLNPDFQLRQKGDEDITVQANLIRNKNPSASKDGIS